MIGIGIDFSGSRTYLYYCCCCWSYIPFPQFGLENVFHKIDTVDCQMDDWIYATHTHVQNNNNNNNEKQGSQRVDFLFMLRHIVFKIHLLYIFLIGLYDFPLEWILHQSRLPPIESGKKIPWQFLYNLNNIIGLPPRPTREISRDFLCMRFSTVAMWKHIQCSK